MHLHLISQSHSQSISHLWLRTFFLQSVFSPQIKQTQDEEKKQLTALRDLIKSSLQLDQKEVGRSH